MAPAVTSCPVSGGGVETPANCRRDKESQAPPVAPIPALRGRKMSQIKIEPQPFVSEVFIFIFM